MNARRLWPLAVPALLVAGADGGLLLERAWNARQKAPSAAAPDASAGDEEAPVAAVEVVTATLGPIARKAVAYGTTVVRSADSVTVAWPSEVRVRRVLVVQGQRVEAKAPVAEVEASQDATTQIVLGRTELHAAQENLDATRARRDLKLATQQEVVQAEAAVATARMRLGRLTAVGPPPGGIVRAPAGGVISTIAVTSGATLASGAPIAMLLSAENVVAEIGLEPGDAAFVQADMHVALTPLLGDGAPAIDAVVAQVSSEISAATHFRNVYLTLPKPAPLLGTPLRAEVTLQSELQAVLVPREAVLPGSEGDIAFVVTGGVANLRKVEVGIRGATTVQIVRGIAAGEQVIVLGHAVLSDGSKVRARGGEP